MIHRVHAVGTGTQHEINNSCFIRRKTSCLSVKLKVMKRAMQTERIYIMLFPTIMPGFSNPYPLFLTENLPQLLVSLIFILFYYTDYTGLCITCTLSFTVLHTIPVLHLRTARSEPAWVIQVPGSLGLCSHQIRWSVPRKPPHRLCTPAPSTGGKSAPCTNR